MASCPRCGGALVAEKLGQMTVDGCEGCGGVWFDADELCQLAKGGKTAMEQAEGVFEPPAAEGATGAGDMQCPKCAVALYEFEFKHTPGVKLDACPECKGVWVDDSELAGLAERVADKSADKQRPKTRQQKARTAACFMQQAECRDCGEMNPATALVCWVCGKPLQGRRGAMLCPRCDEPLRYRSAASSGLQIDVDPHLDHCQCCGGIWVSSGDMSLLMDFDVHWLRMWGEELDACAVGTPDLARDDLICPVCQVILDRRAYAQDDSAYVDRCLCCEGTWLDRGELVRVRQISIEQDVWRRAE